MVKKGTTGKKYRTKEQIQDDNARLLEGTKQVIAEEGRFTLKHLDYRMLGMGLYKKSRANYQALSELTTQWRKDRIIPYDVIFDGTRYYRKPASHNSLVSMLEENVKNYRRKMWNSQKTYCEIWCEKDAILSMLYPVTSKYDVPLYPVRGQASTAAIYELYLSLKEQENAGKQVVIGYLGDYDDYGLKIANSIKTRLKEQHGYDLNITWLAITPEQIEKYGLGTREAKREDNEIQDCCEIDMLPTKFIQALVEDFITKHINPDEWSKELAAERLELETTKNAFPLLITAIEHGTVDDVCQRLIDDNDARRKQAIINKKWLECEAAWEAYEKELHGGNLDDAVKLYKDVERLRADLEELSPGFFQGA